jgi:hypothetical protein
MRGGVPVTRGPLFYAVHAIPVAGISIGAAAALTAPHLAPVAFLIGCAFGGLSFVLIMAREHEIYDEARGDFEKEHRWP